MKTAHSSLTILLTIGLTICLSVLLACSQKSETPEATTRSVWFGNLKDGQEVTSPFTVEMKAENLVVEAAANGVADGHGHFHILVNSPLPESPLPIPKDSLHIHYGKGDTVTTLDLPVGEHTLTLQFAKGDHVPYDPQIAQTIHVKVTGRTP